MKALTSQVVAGAAAAVLGSAAAAGAALAADTPELQRVEVTTGSRATSKDAAVRDRLEALAETQTPQEASAIERSGRPATLLVDKHNRTIAGYYEPSQISPFSIGVSGPGCGNGYACAKTRSGVPYGYYGSGSLRITISNIVSIYAGDRLTTFWKGTTGVFVNTNQTKYFQTARTFDKITRSS